jgi:hypothetical protein
MESEATGGQRSACDCGQWCGGKQLPQNEATRRDDRRRQPRRDSSDGGSGDGGGDGRGNWAAELEAVAAVRPAQWSEAMPAEGAASARRGGALARGDRAAAGQCHGNGRVATTGCLRSIVAAAASWQRPRCGGLLVETGQGVGLATWRA